MKRIFEFLAYFGISLAGIACGGEPAAIPPFEGQSSHSCHGKACVACESGTVCRTANEALKIDEIMAGAPKTRGEVLDNRIWGDERKPLYWEEDQKTIRLEDLPLLWREACWYGLAKRWWADGECFYIMEEPGWCGHPLFYLHIYACQQNSEFRKIATLTLCGLGDDGVFKGEVSVEQGKVIFSKKGRHANAVDLGDGQIPAAEARKVVFEKNE